MTDTIRYRLGLDLGANSLGWMVLELEPRVKWQNAQPQRILAAGVRMFEAGVEGSIEQGKDSSRGAVRRAARQPRRQHWRRQRRMTKLFGILQRLELLPPTEDQSAEQRMRCFESLDQCLTDKWCPADDIDAHQKLPYLLRAAALDQTLEPYELGRALYHLGQRRGYRPNRKTDRSDDEEAGKVAHGIETLNQARRIEVDGATTIRTLAQTVRDEFKQTDGIFALESESQTESTRRRIRGRYTAREMYTDEFHRIRAAQSATRGPIDDAGWRQIEKAIFHQRPLKSQKNLVGRCTLEKDRYDRGLRRCTIALPEFQEFRLLQGLNHLKIVLPDGEFFHMTDRQRAAVVDHLTCNGDLPLQPLRVKKKGQLPPPSLMMLLDLPKGTKFSASPFQDHADQDDSDDDSRLIGHRTNAKLRPIFGERWDSIDDATRREIIYSVLYLSNPISLQKLAQRNWKLDDNQAKELSKVNLEEGFGALSLKAIRRLLPLLRTGISYAEARKLEFPDSVKATEPKDSLLPVTQWNGDIRNPAVIRALSEVRKVVNALITRYGKPTTIHIELARDLKQSRDKRKDAWKNNEDNRKRREKAVRAILDELGRSNPTRDLVDKWLLAEECGWLCPYTNKVITPKTLEHFDIEHIYPRRYLDDSFTNKTLCDANFNRNVKKDRLPSACLSGDAWEQSIDRVKRFNGSLGEEKLRRFAATSVPEDFVDRQLNDTRYNSRLAADYLGSLFGGRNDIEGHQRIVTPTGKLTWLLRKGWSLNSVLSDTDEKNRRDNRHHAVDALCVALSSQTTIHFVSGLASREYVAGNRFDRFLSALVATPPWESFLDDTRKSIRAIVVSHRPSRTIAGPLHAETNYSKPHVHSGKGPAYRIRKSLDKLTAKEIEGDQIIDRNVRLAVQEKYRELCEAATIKKDQQPANMWANLAHIEKFPRLAPSKERLRTGQATHGSPIFSVRLATDAKPRTIGRGPRTRQVASGKDSNYASMLYAVIDNSGKEVRWEHEIITRLEAHLRLSANGGGKKKRKSNQRQDQVPQDTNNQSAGPQNAPERVMIPRTTAELSQMTAPPFKLKKGETIRYLGALVKNDMVELDGSDGNREIYRVQKLSESEIQLCEHYRTTITNEDRTPANRISSLKTLKQRNIRLIKVNPTGGIIEQPLK